MTDFFSFSTLEASVALRLSTSILIPDTVSGAGVSTFSQGRGIFSIGSGVALRGVRGEPEV